MAAIELPMWAGRQILEDKHAPDLDSRAAHYEVNEKLPRHVAEERAHDEYRKEQHSRAAAFHLMQMKAAQGAGTMDHARKAGVMYGLHVKAIGEDPYGPVPQSVKQHVDAPDRDNAFKFKAHKGDAFLLHKTEELAKGDVIEFPGNKNPSVDHGRTADAVPLRAPPSDVRAPVGGYLMNVVKRGNNPQCWHQDSREDNSGVISCRDCGGVFRPMTKAEWEAMSKDERNPFAPKQEERSPDRYQMGYCQNCRRETIHDQGWCRACPRPANAQPRPTPALRRSEEEFDPDRLHTLYKAVQVAMVLLQKGDVIKFPGKQADPDREVPKKGPKAKVISLDNVCSGCGTNLESSKVGLCPKCESAQKEKVGNIFQSAFEAMASDPGMQAAAKERKSKDSEARIAAGPQRFKPGMQVKYNDVDSDGAIPQDWTGTVTKHHWHYMDETPHRFYEVRWWNPKLRQYHEDFRHQDDLVPV